MDVREKLVELIGSTEYGNGSLVGKNFQKGFIEKIVSNLITNGVTVQEWISVDDRLPNDNDRVIAFRPNELETSAYKYCVMWGWSVKASLKHRGITHWCAMPNRRKENDYG